MLPPPLHAGSGQQADRSDHRAIELASGVSLELWISLAHQNWEVTGGGVGKWASSCPMLEKKSPVRLLPLMTGTLEGPIHPMSPKPITLRSLRSQSRGNLQTTTSSTDFQQRFHFTEPGHRYS